MASSTTQPTTRPSRTHHQHAGHQAARAALRGRRGRGCAGRGSAQGGDGGHFVSVPTPAVPSSRDWCPGTTGHFRGRQTGHRSLLPGSAGAGEFWATAPTGCRPPPRTTISLTRTHVCHPAPAPARHLPTASPSSARHHDHRPPVLPARLDAHRRRVAWSVAIAAFGADPGEKTVPLVGFAIGSGLFQVGVLFLLRALWRTQALGTGRLARFFLRAETVVLSLAIGSTTVDALRLSDLDQTGWLLLDLCWPLSMLGMFAIGIRIAIAGRWKGLSRFWPMVAESWAVVTVPTLGIFGAGRRPRRRCGPPPHRLRRPRPAGRPQEGRTAASRRSAATQGPGMPRAESARGIPVLALGVEPARRRNRAFRSRRPVDMSSQVHRTRTGGGR